MTCFKIYQQINCPHCKNVVSWSNTNTKVGDITKCESCNNTFQYINCINCGKINFWKKSNYIGQPYECGGCFKMVNPSPKPKPKARPKTTGTAAKRPIVRRNSGKNGLKTDKLNLNNNCDVCFDKPKNMAFIPCGHITCCETCSEKIITDRGLCIICNQEVTSALKIYTT